MGKLLQVKLLGFWVMKFSPIRISAKTGVFQQFHVKSGQFLFVLVENKQVLIRLISERTHRWQYLCAPRKGKFPEHGDAPAAVGLRG